MSAPLSRRAARDLAFQFLYGNLPIPTEKGANPSFNEQDFAWFCENFGSAFDEFAWLLCHGTRQNLSSLDEQISKLSENWRIERMSKVDLTALRIGTFEILFVPDVPKTVSVFEAVELAKTYGAEESAAFTNGILDKLIKPT